MIELQQHSQVQRNRERVKCWKNSDEHNLPQEPKQSEVIDIENIEDVAECAFKDPVIGSDTASVQPSTLENSLVETTSTQDQQSSAVANSPPVSGKAEGEQSSVATTQDKPQDNSSYRHYRTRSQTHSHRHKSFWYKSVHVPLKCVHCNRDYNLKPPTKSYFCTLCPAFICTHCIDYGYHTEHNRTLKGPGSLSQIFDRYSSRW